MEGNPYIPISINRHSDCNVTRFAGTGLYKFKAGGFYQGSFYDGLFHGQGIQKSFNMVQLQCN